MTLQNAIRGKRAKRAGAAGEMAARDFLRYLGLGMVCVIETGWKVNRHPVTRKIVGAHPIAPVAGDIRALIPDSGRSVLAEVKSRPDRLVWSDLEAHQVDALDHHQAAGGLSLLIWRHATGLVVLPWRPVGFNGPRTALSVEEAEAQAIRTPRFWLLPAGMVYASPTCIHHSLRDARP